MNDEGNSNIETIASIILGAMYPQLTSRMEGPFKAANSVQRRMAMDAATEILRLIGGGDKI